MSQKPVQSEALGELRVQIDSLDRQLLQLLNERAKVAEKVGEIKRAEGSPFFRPDRVAQVIDKITGANPGPLHSEHVASIWREIMSACLALEAPQRVAVLGPQGTFCEQAAIEFFGSAASLIYCANFDEVFHATAAGTAQYGVVGMENSTEGVVARSLDLFLRSPVHVVGEVSLLVRHNLLRQTPGDEGIEVVLAHPQALAQCQGWLSQHLPLAERRAARPAMPKAPAWPPATPSGRRWPANARPRNLACTSCTMPSRTRPTTAHASP
jgi:chorismate mutase/prephenate dehydratase